MFALNYSHGTLKKPALANMVGGGRIGRGLGGLDGAGQSGMIQAELGQLSELHRAVLTARYADRSTPCSCRRPCCRSWTANPEWDGAIAWLTEHVLVMGLTGTISHYRFRRCLIERYFGVRVSFIDIAAQCKVNRDTASDQHAKVAGYFKGKPPALRGVEWHAVAAFEGRMKAAGIID